MINCGTVVDLTPVSVVGEKFSDKAMLERAEFFKKNFIDKDKLGVKIGEGFYKYPHPVYSYPGFLK
jgi:3-hydroxybutyryl-CoA dehydrogenase